MTQTDDSIGDMLLGRTSQSKKSRQRTYAILCVLGGITGLGAASMGFWWWNGADYFHHQGAFPHGWLGYDMFTFIGLLLVTVFSSPGVTLLYVGVSTLMRLSSGVLGLAAFGALGVAFVVVGSLGMVWGSETMKCLVIFCIDTTKYVEVSGAIPEAGLGFRSIIGITAFFSLVPMGLVMLTQVTVRTIRLDRRWLAPKRQRLVLKPTFIVPFAVVAFVLIMCWTLVSFYVPNSWEYFTASGIAINAQRQITQNYTLCKHNRTHFTCPELPWSWVFTRNWVWSDTLVLKIYPGNMFFFSYLLLTLLSVITIRASRAGRKLMIWRPWLLRSFTCGEAGFALLTVSMLLLFFLYWLLGHNYKCKYNGVSTGVAMSERWARSLGHLAVALLSLCVFPTGRHSVLHSVTGTSWGSSIWVHKVLGYGVLLATTGHMVAWYVRYGEVGVFPRAVLSIHPVHPPGHVDNFTVPLITLITWFVLVAMGAFALEPVRRRFFELFYYLHIVAFYAIVPAVLWHAAAAWEYFLPGLTVWFMDRLLRMYQSASAVEVVSAVASDAFVEISFRHATLSAAPGQYVFVNVPELSLFQWHPFSFSSIREGCYTLHIKSMGEGTWTGQLVELVRAHGNNISLSVDGPCGLVLDFRDYKAVVLVAGGIGVAPCAAIYSYFRRLELEGEHCPAVTLLWTFHNSELLPMISHLWDDNTGNGLSYPRHLNKECGEGYQFVTTSGAVATPRLFLTGCGSFECISSPRVSVATQSLDVATEIPRAIVGEDPREVLVFVCGPANLVSFTKKIVFSLGVNFHEECFLL